MSLEPVTYQREGNIGILSLNRPEKLNAMTEAMGSALEMWVGRLNAEAGLRCVMVRGEGRAFSAGGDLDFLVANTERQQAENACAMQIFYQRFLALRELVMPSMALLRGRATGAGLCVALACDLRFAAADALLSVNFTRVGLTPGMGGSWLLPRLIGPAKAAELLYTGRTVSAAEALAMGLVNGVFANDALEYEGRKVALAIAEAAPEAVRETKALLRASETLSLAGALEQEASKQAKCFAGPELREGIEAIRDRRAPRF
jgi:enoyl-CoA hydratase